MTKPAASTEARDLRSLLEVVLDAITLPHDAHDYDQRIRERTAWARSAVKGALAEDPADLGWNVDFLRGKLAAEQADADERAKQACRACHRPFTPADINPATARYGDTPWCRACLAHCENNTTNERHTCPLCQHQKAGGDAS